MQIGIAGLPGSGKTTLFNALAQENLIDLYRFMVHPIILGKGKRLFAEVVERRVLALTETKAFKAGIVVVEYVPAKNR